MHAFVGRSAEAWHDFVQRVKRRLNERAHICLQKLNRILLLEQACGSSSDMIPAIFLHYYRYGTMASVAQTVALAFTYSFYIDETPKQKVQRC
jgi:hypothetical protein